MSQLSATDMAADIVSAISKQVPLGAGEDPSGRHKLALAIARGVLQNIYDNPTAFHVTVPDLSGGSHEQQVTIEIDQTSLG